LLPSPTAPRILTAASTLILSAYQTRHQLSAEEAERLGRSVADMLATLHPAPSAPASATAAPKPVRRAKRTKATAQPELDLEAPSAPVEEFAPEPAVVAAVIVEPIVSEPEIEPEIEPGVEDPEPVASLAMVLAEAEPEDLGTDEPILGMTKRKRPSRPRSKRGNRDGAGNA